VKFLTEIKMATNVHQGVVYPRKTRVDPLDFTAADWRETDRRQYEEITRPKKRQVTRLMGLQAPPETQETRETQETQGETQETCPRFTLNPLILSSPSRPIGRYLPYQVYAPSPSDLVGNLRGTAMLEKWLGEWHAGKLHDNFAVVTGPAGCGKTLGAKVFMIQKGFSVNELTSLMSREEIQFKLKNAVKRSFDGKLICFFIEDADTVITNDKALLNLTVAIPVVGTAPKRMTECKHNIAFYPFSDYDSRKIIRRVQTAAAVSGLNEDNIIALSRGDGRQLVLNCVFYSGTRDMSVDPFKSLKLLVAGDATMLSHMTDFSTQCILENYCKFTDDLEDAYQLLESVLCTDSGLVSGLCVRRALKGKRMTLSDVSCPRRHEVRSSRSAVYKFNLECA
jgi:hypothetical protein